MKKTKNMTEKEIADRLLALKNEKNKLDDEILARTIKQKELERKQRTRALVLLGIARAEKCKGFTKMLVEDYIFVKKINDIKFLIKYFQDLDKKAISEYEKKQELFEKKNKGEEPIYPQPLSDLYISLFTEQYCITPAEYINQNSKAKK